MAEFVTTTGLDGAAVLAVSGELDIAAVDEFLEHGEKLIHSGVAVITIDLGEVSFIDSSGLGALVRLRQSAAEGQRLRLGTVPKSVARVLQITGLTELFADRPES
jgi:anti-sigma B factor antagonist